MEPYVGRDPIKHVIEQGMLRDIRIAADNNAFRGAMILVYCGIDAMSNLYMPEDKVSATKQDFRAWIEKYYTPVLENILTWEDVYSARNGLVHAYTSDSDFTRSGKAKTVNYFAGHPNRVKYLYNPEVDPKYILVSYEYLIESFIEAVDRFISDLSQLNTPLETIKARLASFLIVVPGDENEAAKL